MTFEEILFSAKRGSDGRVLSPEGQAKAFGEACRAIFSTPQGRHVLAVLCGAAHPLKHSQGMTEHEHGRSEVVVPDGSRTLQNRSHCCMPMDPRFGDKARRVVE
jgi:hypothetical protein